METVKVINVHKKEIEVIDINNRNKQVVKPERERNYARDGMDSLDQYDIDDLLENEKISMGGWIVSIMLMIVIFMIRNGIC